jgi:biopolymer transport protein ExbB/TolQ
MSIAPSEVTVALTFAKAIGLAVDISEATSRAWAVYFADSPFDFNDLQEAIKRYRGSDFLTAKTLDEEMRKARRLRPQYIAADVRSARARRLVSADWPEDKPLPRNVMQQIEAARQNAQEKAAREELEAPEGAVTLPRELLATTGQRAPYGRAHDGYKDD